MTIEQIVIEEISTRITALTGKVYFLSAEQNAAEPYGVVSTASSVPGFPSLGDFGAQTQVQLAIYHADRFDLAEIVETIKGELYNVRGTFHGIEIDLLRVSGTLLRVIDIDQYQAIVEITIGYRR